MMNPEVKAKWLEALRSGDYQQGYNWLRPFSDKFCCLGVLCDLYHKETGNGQWNDDGFLGGTVSLPLEVIDWGGLKTVHCVGRLADMNDEGCSFNGIADYIEANL